MPADLDPRDLEEVRRRVVEPVVRSLIRREELDDVWVYLDTDFVSVSVKAGGKLVNMSTLGPLGEGLWDAVKWADHSYDMLTTDLPMSTFAWGQLREGQYQVPGPDRSGD